MTPAWSLRDELRELGRTVRELRARKGFSQEQLGHASGLHRNYVGGIERGEQNITFRILLKITHGLDVPLSELVEMFERNRTARRAAIVLAARRLEKECA